jgi:hypothetical protein
VILVKVAIAILSFTVVGMICGTTFGSRPSKPELNSHLSQIDSQVNQKLARAGVKVTERRLVLEAAMGDS